MIRHFYIFLKKVFPKPRGKGNALYVIDPFLVCNQNWWLLVFILEPVRYEIINACDLCIIVSTENNTGAVHFLFHYPVMHTSGYSINQNILQ